MIIYKVDLLPLAIHVKVFGRTNQIRLNWTPPRLIKLGPQVHHVGRLFHEFIYLRALLISMSIIDIAQIMIISVPYWNRFMIHLQSLLNDYKLAVIIL